MSAEPTERKMVDVFSDIDRDTALRANPSGYAVTEIAASDDRVLTMTADLSNTLAEFREAFPDGVREIRQALEITRAVQRCDALTGASLRSKQSAIDAMALGPPPTEPGYLESMRQQWLPIVRRDAVKPMTRPMTATEDSRLPKMTRSNSAT